MPQKYALLMNGFSKTDAQKLMNGFSKTDSPHGRGPPNRWAESGFLFVAQSCERIPKNFWIFCISKSKSKFQYCEDCLALSNNKLMKKENTK